MKRCSIWTRSSPIFVECVSEVDPRRATQEAVVRALTAPTAVADAIAPDTGGISLLYHSPELTVINVAWAPSMQIMPHDHRMWAVIGIYAGAEENQFYRRGADGQLAETTNRRLDVGDVCLLGLKTIHAVANPMDRLTATIHVYGGNSSTSRAINGGPAISSSVSSTWRRSTASSIRPTRPAWHRAADPPPRTHGAPASIAFAGALHQVVDRHADLHATGQAIAAARRVGRPGRRFGAPPRRTRGVFWDRGLGSGRTTVQISNVRSLCCGAD